VSKQSPRLLVERADAGFGRPGPTADSCAAANVLFIQSASGSIAAKPERPCARQSPPPYRARAGSCRCAHPLVPLSKLIEGAGGKLLSFYFTTGDTDFMVISEANDSESIIAALLAAVAAGTISDVKTARAWTGAEFKAVAENASKAASHYRAPGKG
jgi:uncharacterized protein with GYD domain